METQVQAPSAQPGLESNAASHEPSAKEVTQAFEGKNQNQKPKAQAQTPPAPEKPKASPETYEVKVNGKTLKLTLDELRAEASKSHAANSRFEEAAKMRAQAEKIINQAKSNPIEALMDPALGLSKDQVRDYFEKWYKEQFIDPEALSPEQRRASELEKELEAFKKEKKEREEKALREEQEKLTSQQRDYLQTQIVEALEKSELPKSPWVVQRMAFYMRQNLANGWDAPMDLIVRQVNQDRMQLMSDISENSSPEQIIKMLGEGLINKLRRYDLEQLRAKRQFPQAPSTQKQEPRESQGRMTMGDVNKRLNDMRRGKF